MLRKSVSRFYSNVIYKRPLKAKNVNVHELKKSPKIIDQFLNKKSQLKELYLDKLCGPDKYETLANSQNLLENKKAVIRNKILLNESQKSLVPVDWDNSNNALSQMSSIGVKYLLSDAKIQMKDIPSITSLLDNVPYETLKNLTANILKRYSESPRPMPPSVYENLLLNYKQNLENQSSLLPPSTVFNDIMTLLNFREQEVKNKMNSIVPELDESGKLARKHIYENILEQLYITLDFKKKISPLANESLREIGFSGKGNELTLETFNSLLAKLTEVFGLCELRSVHTDVIKILGTFKQADSQFKIFSHMKFLSIRNNSPDEDAYASLLDTYIKENELFKSIDLVEEFKQNMMQHYDTIYMQNIALNQFLKDKIPLLPLHYKDPAHFDNLNKLMDQLVMERGFSHEEISEYYMGVPIALRIKLVKAISETLKTAKFNDLHGQDTLISLKKKAWYICYGIIQELSVPKSASVSKDVLLESSKENDAAGLVVPSIDHVDASKSSKSEIKEEKQVIESNENNHVLNKLTEEFSYEFTNVLLSLASIDKDVDFARALYSTFFTSVILPKTKASTDINNVFDYKQRESWAEVFSMFMESYGSAYKLVSKLDTQTKGTISKIMEQGIKLGNSIKADSVKLYESDPIINAMRSKIINSVNGDKSNLLKSPGKLTKSLHIGFLPITSIENDEGLRLAESAAVMKLHYFNFDLKNQVNASNVEVPTQFVEQIAMISEAANELEALNSLQLLFFNWYVKHCKAGRVNGAMTSEELMLRYVEAPRSMADYADHYTKRMDEFFIDFTRVFKVFTDYKETSSPEHLKSLYLETFKSWKTQNVLNSQMTFNVMNNDPGYLTRTWNEQTSLNNLTLFKKMKTEGKSAKLTLKKSNFEFYNKYALALLLNDMGTEGFNFIDQTKDLVTYTPHTLEYFKAFFFEIEDMGKVAKILELEKLMAEKAKEVEETTVVSL